MNKRELYQQIAEIFRQNIFRGDLKPGDKLPSMRELSSHWDCTIGTVQRAYQQLASEGLVSSHHGQGTRVVSTLPDTQSSTIRTVNLVHKAEAFLIESFMTGHNQAEIETAIQLALDHWRQADAASQKEDQISHRINFSGSHDLALILVAANFDELHPDFHLELSFNGSLGGLFELSEGKVDIAGCHLWDSETNSYNDPFIHKIFPQGAHAITLAKRRVGWITSPGNPKRFSGLSDLLRDDINSINRQNGSGSRVWLDARLKQNSMEASKINGYENEVWTHSEAAQKVAEQKADVAFGLEAAAMAFDLHFDFITLEQYDLVYHSGSETATGLQVFLNYLQSPGVKKVINKLSGYDTNLTGKMRRI